MLLLQITDCVTSSGITGLSDFQQFLYLAVPAAPIFITQPIFERPILETVLLGLRYLRSGAQIDV